MDRMRERHGEDFTELHQIKPKVEELEAKLARTELEKETANANAEEMKVKISEV